jgi:hypothetical protein
MPSSEADERHLLDAALLLPTGDECRVMTDVVDRKDIIERRLLCR